MKNDFKPVVDHRFTLSPMGAVDCQVTAVDPNKPCPIPGRLCLESVVTWTLTPRARELTCVWNSRASGRSAARLPGPNTGGRSSLRTWNRYCADG